MKRRARVDLRRLKTYPLSTRKNKVDKEQFGLPYRAGSSFHRFFDSLPDLLAARSLKEVAGSIAGASSNGKQVIFMMGAHTVKSGISPVIIDLMERKVLKCIALNGAGSIHDFEIALAGKTSEDVATGIEDGTFGMARETARMINKAVKDGAKRGIGIGAAIGEMILRKKLPNRHLSILAKGTELGIPVTIHVAIGTDIVHHHPSCDGSSFGKGSLCDFHTFIEEVSKLGGGVIANIGSTVILPEVFLKALTTARNLGFPVRDFTAVNFDMIQHYRPLENVVRRPTLAGGKGYSITGHHEIMIPLLAAAVIEKIERKR